MYYEVHGSGKPLILLHGAFEMRNVGVEESREMYGLLISAAWMAVLALRARTLRAQTLVATPREITQRA